MAAKRPRVEIKNKEMHFLSDEPSKHIKKLLSMSSWQEDTQTISERDKYLLKNNMFTDVTFVVGEEKERYPCHRLFLAKSSPVFASMLFGELFKSNEDIIIPDVEPNAFRILLMYIYTGKWEIKGFESCWEVLYAAKKYLMPSLCLAELRGWLRQWIKGYKDTNCKEEYHIWSAVEFATQCDEQELLELAWTQVQQDTKGVLNNLHFTEISISTLETLVKNENLHCTELELFQACINWGKSELSRQNLPYETENLRNVLDPIVPFIRVLNIEKLEYISEILSVTEILSISKRELPAYFNTNENIRREKSPDSFTVFGQAKNQCGFCIAGEGGIPNFSYTEEVSKCCDVPDQEVYGLEMTTQLKENAGEDEEYKEDLTIYFMEHIELNKENMFDHTYKSSKLIQVYHFNEYVKYNSSIKIHFKFPYAFSDAKNYIYFDVIFHKSGKYPLINDSFLVPIIDSIDFISDIDTSEFDTSDSDDFCFSDLDSV